MHLAGSLAKFNSFHVASKIQPENIIKDNGKKPTFTEALFYNWKISNVKSSFVYNLWSWNMIFVGRCFFLG